MATAEVIGTERSEASAKESTQSFSAEARAPLAHSTNPKSKQGITFAHEDSLPKLPIPDLEGSCKKYIAALKPLQSPKEHSDTVLSVSEFLKADGPVLQDKLKKYASGKNNYIEQFCKYFEIPHRINNRAYKLAPKRNQMPTIMFEEHTLTVFQGTIHISILTIRWFLI